MQLVTKGTKGEHQSELKVGSPTWIVFPKKNVFFFGGVWVKIYRMKTLKLAFILDKILLLQKKSWQKIRSEHRARTKNVSRTASKWIKFSPKPNPSKIIGNLQQIIRIMFELCGGNEQRMHKNCLRTLDGRLRTICGHLWRDFSQGLMDFTIFAKCSIHVDTHSYFKVVIIIHKNIRLNL